MLLLAAFVATALVPGCSREVPVADKAAPALSDAQVDELVRRSYQYVAMYNVNNKFAIGQGGWNYTVRLYQPRKEILDGSWRFPEVKPVESK